MTYKIRKTYPGLKFEVGTILIRYAPTVGFVYYSDIYDSHQLRKEDVEMWPNYFEKL